METETAIRAGRVIGVLILIQIIGGALLNMVLEAPLFGTPGFLVNAAPHARQIGFSALLALTLEALWLGITITAFPVLFERTRALTLWLLALSTAILAVAVLENAGVMSMVSLSDAYTKADPAGREQFQLARLIVASTRNWAHYLARLLDGVTILVFYVALFRHALVPRVLTGFGMIAVASMMTSVALPLFGHPVIFPMLAPLGLAQLALALWLMAKGFRSRA